MANSTYPKWDDAIHHIKAPHQTCLSYKLALDQVIYTGHLRALCVKLPMLLVLGQVDTDWVCTCVGDFSASIDNPDIDQQPMLVY